MLKRFFSWLRRYLPLMLIAGLLLVLVPRLITRAYSKDRIYNLSEVPTERVAIVYGAGLRRDGSPTRMLRDRVQTGAHLYFSGKVEKLLMSGDNRYDDYNEPEAMRQYAISLGVPSHAIVLDYAGRRTYDTCYRAKAVFGVESAVLVTQSFHLPRAIFLCNMLGVEAVGVSASKGYWTGSSIRWILREQLSTVVAFVDLYIRHPSPVLGEPEPIFVD